MPGDRHLLLDAAGDARRTAPVRQVAGVGAITSNLINNLPAYLVIEPHAAGGGDIRLLARLVGTIVGTMVLLWDRSPRCCGANAAGRAVSTCRRTSSPRSDWSASRWS
jgi:hypothetical protein